MTTLGITHAHAEGIVSDIDDTNYFELGISSTERKDLFLFATALGVHKMVPEPLKTKKDSFVRLEYMKNEYYMLSSAYFNDKIAENISAIDEITDQEKITDLAEEYANAGFAILKNFLNTENNEQLMCQLIAEMDELYEENEDDINNII